MAAFMSNISTGRKILFCIGIFLLTVSQASGDGDDVENIIAESEHEAEDSQYPQSVVLEVSEDEEPDFIEVTDIEIEDFQSEVKVPQDEGQDEGTDDQEEEIPDEEAEEVFDKPCERNATADAETATQHENKTQNDEEKPKYVCTHIELKENETASTKIINNTDLFQVLNRTNSTEGPCSVVLFYAPWCRFSAAVAPHINALGRAYPTLQVLAVDAIQFSGLNARFGTVAVPNILLFHNGKPVARFNQSVRTFDNFKSFIKNHTGVEADPSVEVTEEDYLGPIPSTPTIEPDYFLWFSTIFIFTFSCFIFKQKFGERIMERFRTWAEIHEHMD